MLKRRLITTSAAGTILAASVALAQTRTTDGRKTGYAAVNGLNLYYEIHGTGDPLIVLHGGLGSTGLMSGIVAPLAKSRRVIAVDLQAHGRTADIERAMSFEAMADDIAGLMKHLQIGQADVMGYSLGGGVALRTAIQHPEMVRKLVLVSTVYRRDGWYPEVSAAMAQLGPAAAEAMKPSPLYKLYASVAPRPEDWGRLVTKVADLLKKDYDWSSDLVAMKTPTMLVFADADAIRPAHMVQFFELLGGGKKDAGWDGSGMSRARLAVLPGVTHYNILSSPGLVPTVASFLDGSMAGGK